MSATATFTDFHAEIAELRKEVRGLFRLIIGGFLTLFVTLVVGFTAIIAKLYFGA